MKTNDLKETKAITLIALVVTIVVLLILAGVSIAVLTGENGILNRATEAKKTSEESEVMENIRLAYNNAQIGKHSGANEIFEDKMDSDLELIYGNGNVAVTKENDKYIIEITGKGTYEILADGTVQKQGASIVTGEVTFVLKDSNGQIVATPKIQGEGIVEIHFTASLAGGTITSVTSTGLSPTLTNNEWVTEVSANGTYKFTINGTTEDGNKSTTKSVVVNKFSSVPSGLAIGSIVNYTPTEATYEWRGEYATNAAYTNETTKSTNTDVTLNNATNARVTTWKVLDIDENAEMVKLVPANNPTQMVKLEGGNGYNNAVFLLNEACKTLYTNTSLGITAENVRNINLEDIEEAMTETAITTAKNSYNHNNTSSYSFLNSSDQVSSAYSTNNSYYPLIYAQEAKAVINGRTNFGTLNESQQTALIGRKDTINELQSDGTTTEKTASQGIVQATKSIQPYQTNYYMSLSDSGNEAKAGQGAVLCPSGANYWVASRYISVATQSCTYYIRRVSNSSLGGAFMFTLSTSSFPIESSLFPVVFLSAELITKSGSNFQVGSQN